MPTGADDLATQTVQPQQKQEENEEPSDLKPRISDQHMAHLHFLNVIGSKPKVRTESFFFFFGSINKR